MGRYEHLFPEARTTVGKKSGKTVILIENSTPASSVIPGYNAAICYKGFYFFAAENRDWHKIIKSAFMRSVTAEEKRLQFGKFLLRS